MMLVDSADDDALARATAALDAGELVVVPGDVCYLVAADALDDDAIERLLLAKQRGADRGLTVLVGGAEDVHHVAFGGASVQALADEHWPGPVSLALKARPWLPDAVTGGQTSVLVSVPAHAFTRALAKRFGPLAVAPARRSGAPMPLGVEAARAFGGAALFVSAGDHPPGLEAKVIRAHAVAPD